MICLILRFIGARRAVRLVGGATAVVGLTLAGANRAQPQGATGMISGVVVDSAARRLAGATVRISGTNSRHVTNESGTFAFERLPPGRYGVSVTYLVREAIAAPVHDSAVVRAGDTTRLRVVLRLASFKPDTLPPRIVRGTRPDTAPHETETLDMVARVGRIPLLRAHPPKNGRRELRFWIGGGIAIPYTLVRMSIDGARVHGEVIRYVEQTIPDRESRPEWHAFVDSVPTWLRQAFRCGSVLTDTLHYPGAQFPNHLVAVCTSRYRHALDWRALLDELESHQVWTLPDPSELPSIGNIVSVDGGGVTVEAWNGTRYHTYAAGDADLIPAPEARDLEAIHTALIRFLRRNHEIGSPPSR